MLILVMIILSMIIVQRTLLIHLSIPHQMIRMYMRYHRIMKILKIKISFLYDRQERNDKQNFRDMLKDKHSYPNANSIVDSKILSRKRTKIYAVYEHYSLYREFPEDKRKSRSPSKKIKLKLYWFSWGRTWTKLKFKE